MSTLQSRLTASFLQFKKVNFGFPASKNPLLIPNFMILGLFLQTALIQTQIKMADFGPVVFPSTQMPTLDGGIKLNSN